MQFLSVASHVCTPASSRQALTDLPLPSASGYHQFNMSNRFRHSHRGLTPHYIAPMLGAHNRSAARRPDAARRRSGRQVESVTDLERVTGQELLDRQALTAGFLQFADRQRPVSAGHHNGLAINA